MSDEAKAACTGCSTWWSRRCRSSIAQQTSARFLVVKRDDMAKKTETEKAEGSEEGGDISGALQAAVAALRASQARSSSCSALERQLTTRLPATPLATSSGRAAKADLLERGAFRSRGDRRRQEADAGEAEAQAPASKAESPRLTPRRGGGRGRGGRGKRRKPARRGRRRRRRPNTKPQAARRRNLPPRSTPERRGGSGARLEVDTRSTGLLEKLAGVRQQADRDRPTTTSSSVESRSRFGVPEQLRKHPRPLHRRPET